MSLDDGWVPTIGCPDAQISGAGSWNGEEEMALKFDDDTSAGSLAVVERRQNRGGQKIVRFQ